MWLVGLTRWVEGCGRDVHGEGTFSPGKMTLYISFHLSSSEEWGLALVRSCFSCSSVMASEDFSRSLQGASARWWFLSNSGLSK